MKENISRLVVKYNDRIVGYLEELSNHRVAFQYDLLWIQNGFPVSPISLPLSNQVFISSKEYFSGLFGVFFDSLPDGWGELLVRRKLKDRGINFDKLSVLTRLSLLSDNALGGLIYEPNQSDKADRTHQDFDQLSEEIRNLFKDALSSDDFDKIYELGGASGGARPKAHVVIDHEEWIVKFPSSMDPDNIGEKEFQANQLARKSGINVNEFRLLPSAKYPGYFATKRFDRNKSTRVHMISLAAILEQSHRIPNLDYSHFFQVVNLITHSQSDLYEAYRRMCFNVLYENKDDHSKNFAFLYDESLQRYTLSPFYDITQTSSKFEHEMTVLGKGNPTEKDLLDIAKDFNLSHNKCKNIITTIKTIIGK